VPHRRRDEIEIVVSAVHTHLKEPTGPIRATDGRATAYVRRLAAQFGFHNLSGRNQLQAWSLRHPWRLDVLEERPAILIVTGTGIAGALAWLRTRPAPSARTPAESDLERGREENSAGASETFHTDRGNTPPVWLIDGVRDWAERGLYQAELQRMVLAGRISRFDIAQSRSSTPADEPTEATAKLYHSARVTDIVQAEEVEIAQWVRDGAAVYVSGARSMGAGVRRRLLDLVVHHQLTDPPEAAPDLLSGWERDGRLQISVS
jgi:sulfite reductase alpha subunit-like flavoprotein